MVRDEQLIKIALDHAWSYQGLTFPNPAVGSVITDKNSNIISIGVHEYAGGPHAEVNAIKNAYIKLTNDKTIKKLTTSKDLHEYLYKNHNDIFIDKSIYVTLEPCNHEGKTPPCSNLISKLGFKKIVIGTLDPNKKASGGYERLKNDGLHVKINVGQDECKKLLEPFSIWQKKPFVFFKLALSKNNVISGGTITCKESRTHVHALRAKTDLLLIGGNTVRVDRPTLDARLVDGRAPDVLIYSQQKEFDKDIPLFQVPNRKVFIENNFEKINDYHFVMIEGGIGMLNAIKDKINWYLFYRSPHTKDGKVIELDIDLKEYFSSRIGEDTYTWNVKID